LNLTAQLKFLLILPGNKRRIMYPEDLV